MVEPTPFTHVSGYSNRFNEMLKYLQKAGDTVEVITPDNSDGAPAKAHGFKVNNIKGFTFPMYPLITLALDVRMQAWQMMRSFKPDLMHISSPGFLCFMGIVTTKLMGIPLVLSYHTHLPVYARNYGDASAFWRLFGADFNVAFAWKLIRFVHSAADLTLVTSPQIKEELERNGVERVAVWRKGIDTVRFDPKFKSSEMRSTLSGGHPAAPLLVYVGRLGVEKRLHDIKPLLLANPSFRLALVGTGPYEAELKEMFKGTNTVFTGQLSGDDLSAAFASGDCFVMPSDSETLGFVVLEAMASGVPVVGARAGGIPNLIAHGETSLLVNPADPDDLAAKVTRLLGDEPARQAMSRAARAEAEKWDWESATAHLRNVNYADAVANYKQRAGMGPLLFRYFPDRVAKYWSSFTQTFARLQIGVAT